jgi:hypothetical protein
MSKANLCRQVTIVIPLTQLVLYSAIVERSKIAHVLQNSTL